MNPPSTADASKPAVAALSAPAIPAIPAIPPSPGCGGTSASATVQQWLDWIGRSVGFGIWELNLVTGEAHWDEQMWRLRGLPAHPGAVDEALRRQCLHPQDRHRVDDLMPRAAHDGAPFEYEFRVVLPDGQERWLASRSVEPQPSADGVRRRIGVNWDITDSRNADAARRQQALAESDLRARSQFLARMSHELRTPLNAVLGFTELLLSREPVARGLAGDAESALRAQQLGHIQSAGHHLLALIDNVLDLSRVEGGEATMQLAPTSVSGLLAEVLPLLEPLRLAAAVTIETRIDADRVMADATRLRQVLLNLLRNAIVYNLPGGSVQVELLARGAQGSERLLRISDTGRGMAEEQLLHLFEPFSKPGRASGDGHGSGIGLAIVKALVERMGGSVHVDSREGHGSVFELRLAGAEPARMAAADAVLRDAPWPQDGSPSATVERAGHNHETGDGSSAGDMRHNAVPSRSVAADQAQPEDQPAVAPLPDAARHRLLYIEDNPINALIISELLGRRDDLALTIAADGSSGVAEARRLQPMLILLDMQLPDFDGFEVLRRLRADPATRAIPCVAVSANAMPEDIQRAMQAGMSGYWTKPLDFKRFLESLDTMLGLNPGA